MRIIERIAEHYDVQEVEFGKVYKWCAEEVVVDCDCGKRSIFKRSDLLTSKASCCECDKKPSAGIREEAAIRLPDEDYEATNFPWRYWHTIKDTGIPF